MRKRSTLFNLVHVLLGGILLSSRLASAATYHAASCSVSDVASAVSMAADGDTVLVEGGGSCTWGSTIVVSAGITLNGEGNTTISFTPTTTGLDVTTDTAASTVVTGFTFANGFVDGQVPIAVSTQTAPPFNPPFRIYNNTFYDDGSQGSITFLGITGYGPGLIDHNSFTTVNGGDEMIHLLGSGNPSDTSGWVNDVLPGGPNMIFLENNTFATTNDTYSPAAEEAYYGAQWVFRYNHLSFVENDVHQGGLSGRWAEIYENTYTTCTSDQMGHLASYWQFRGGSGVVFDNISSGASCPDEPYPGAQFGPDCPSSDICTGTWPIPSQVGTGINETTNSPIYAWGNDETINGSTQSIQDAIGYSNGTQAGPTPTSCTHPGDVCDVVATDTTPTSWVRCESAADLDAGCPVSYTYTPYPYPHPLDDLSTACFGEGCASGTGSTSAGSTVGSTSSSTTSGPSTGATTSAAAATTGAGNGTTGTANGTGTASTVGTSGPGTTGATSNSTTGSGSTGGGTTGASSSGASSSSMTASTTSGGSKVAGGCGCSSAGDSVSALAALGLFCLGRRRSRE